MKLAKKLSLAIILLLTISCTIPVVQDPVPLPIPREPVYPFIDTDKIEVVGGTVTLPKSVMDAIHTKVIMQSGYIGECKAVIESTH